MFHLFCSVNSSSSHPPSNFRNPNPHIASTSSLRHDITQPLTGNPISSVIYASLLQTCVKTSSFHHGTSVHAHVLKSGLHSDRFVGNSLFFILVRNGFLRAAENIRNSMIKSRESPQDARFVLNLLRLMNTTHHENLAFNLSVTSYNRLLMLLSQFGLVDELNCLFKEMLDDGVLPNLITFNTMLNFHCKLGNMVVGKVYFCGLIKSGFCCDTFTYTSLILGYCKNHELKNAYKVFEIMLEVCFQVIKIN